MGILSGILSGGGGAEGIVEYDTWADLPVAPDDGAQALLCGHLVEYADGEGWAYVFVPSTTLPQGATVSVIAEGPAGSYGAEPPTTNDLPWDTAAWTLVT